MAHSTYPSHTYVVLTATISEYGGCVRTLTAASEATNDFTIKAQCWTVLLSGQMGIGDF